MVLDEETRALLAALAARIVPESASLDEGARERSFALIEKALAARPPATRRQFLLFLKVLKWAPVLRHGAKFEELDGERQDAVLRWFQDAPVSLLRKGFWGTKTLLFMGYYGRPEAGVAVRWTPSFSGNEKLKA